MDSNNDVLLACTIGDLTWLKRGLSNGIKPTTANKEGLNALHLAAKYGQLECIKYLLDNCSIDVNCVALSTGSSALHYSIAHTNPTRSLQCTKLLLNHGGNHKCQNKLGETPLHVAAKYGRIKSVKLLLEKGADIQIKDKEGQTAYNTSCVHNRHECARLLRALHWASKKDSDDREKLRKDEIERRQTNVMLTLQERLRKEAADTSYNQWLEKKSRQENGPSPRERKPMTYTRSTVSSRGASKSTHVSAHTSNPQLAFSIKVNPKQAKRNTASVGKPDKMQPYTNYPPKSASGTSSRSSAYFLGKSRSEPPRSGRTSRSTIRSAVSAPAGVKYYSRIHHRQTTVKRDNKKQAVVDSTTQVQAVEDTAMLENKEAHKSEYDTAEKPEELHYEQLEEQHEQELESRTEGVANKIVRETDEEQLTARSTVEPKCKCDNDRPNLTEYNGKCSDEKVEGSDLYPREKEEEIDELDFSKLQENDTIFNECTIEGDDEDLFHDVGQTNSLNALLLPSTLTKDRTPAEIIQLLRSFGGLSRSYNRSNSFSHDYSGIAHRSRFQRRFSLGAIPEGQIVTNYDDEDRSSSQLLDEQFLESLIHGLSGDSGNARTSKSMQGIKLATRDDDQDSEPESDDSGTLSCGSNDSEEKHSADSKDLRGQTDEQKSAKLRVEISQEDASSILICPRPQSLKVVNLAWDPVLNTVHSHISESPLSPPDFSKIGGRRTPTRRLTPPNNAWSHEVHSPTSSHTSTRSQTSLRISIPSSPRYSPRDLSPSPSSSSVHSSRPSSPRSPSPSDSDVFQRSARETKAEDLRTRSLSSIQEDPFHTPSSHSLCSMSLSMNSLSSKSMVMSSASYDTFSTVGNKIQEMESGQAKKSSECRRVRSAPNICIERRSSPQVLKTAIMEYGGTLRKS